MLAMSFGRIAMVEDLLDAGADPGLPNNKGWTALHQAAYAHPPSDPAPALATLERLLAAGASPYAEAYGDGGTPLAVALFWGHVPLAERLAAAAIAQYNLRVAAGLGRLDLMRAPRGRAPAPGSRPPSRIPSPAQRLSALGGRPTRRPRSSPRR